jgi:predicted dehydrogenase
MVELALAGAGARGKDAYGRWIAKHGRRARLVAVADPDPARLEAAGDEHGIPRERRFPSWREMLSRPRLADACIVATQDNDHTAPALAAMAEGYHVLLEKPMAPTEAECRALVAFASESGRELRICHVLRYAAFFSAIRRAIDEGALGEIVTVNHSENVSYWHFAHSFVRGNWRRSGDSNPLVLAKSCHDLDAISWLVGRRAKAVQSFGSLGFYRPEHAPPGAPERCLDGCPAGKDCPWYAPRIYLRGTPEYGDFRGSPSGMLRAVARLASSSALERATAWREWPATAICNDSSPAARLAALASGPYGRCVFRCDNDVVDRQSVNIEFEGGATALFSLHGHSCYEGRRIRIDGTRGTVEGRFGMSGEELVLVDHYRGKRRTLLRRANVLAGHGGGDSGLMESFIASLEARAAGRTDADPRASAAAALESHLLGFAAERSRLEGRIVPFPYS